MRFLLLFSLLTSLITFDPLPKLRLQDDAKKAAQAQEILSKSRAALGCDKVKSLALAGNYRQTMGEREAAGEIELELVLPDKFLKSTTTNFMPGVELTRVEALNGETAWMDSHNSAPAGGNVVIRMGPNAGNSADTQKAQQMFIRQEWSRVLLGLLVYAPASLQLEFSYAGAAEAPDGVADVLDVKGPGGFAAQLFVDQKTHRPLMVSYKGRKPRLVMHTFDSAAGSKKMTPEELEKQAKEAQAAAAAEPPVEIQIRFMDFNQEGGVELPHRVSRTMGGQINEEWELTKFKINPTIKADKFEKK